MKKSFLYLSIAMAAGFSSCSLDEELGGAAAYDAGEELPAVKVSYTAALGRYASMFQNQEFITAMSEVSSDEAMVSQRTDGGWTDNNQWVDHHLHQWTDLHKDVINTWDNLFSALNDANGAIAYYRFIEDAENEARSRLYRALIMWELTDLYGAIPFRDIDATNYLETPDVWTRATVIQFVIDEIEGNMADLPEWSRDNVTIGNQEAAKAFLAKVYLNRFAQLGENASDSDMDNVISYCDEVIASGHFSLEPAATYYVNNFGNFNGENSNEIIWSIGNSLNNGAGGSTVGSRYMMSMTGEQGGWNGYIGLKDNYLKMDSNDVRRTAPGSDQMNTIPDGKTENNTVKRDFGYSVGPQFFLNGSPALKGNLEPLDFPLDATLLNASNHDGARVIKFEPQVGFEQFPDNDNPLFRYADIILMKAEAEWRKGNSGAAVTLINELRASRGLNNSIPDISGISADGIEILDERGHEFYWENHRRTDLIRFGKFQDEWIEKPAESDDHTNLFPKPATALAANPKLQQNPGY